MRRGTHTSEFWGFVVGIAVIIFQDHLGITIDPDVQSNIVLALAGLFGARTGYKAVDSYSKKTVQVTGLERDPLAGGGARSGSAAPPFTGSYVPQGPDLRRPPSNPPNQGSGAIPPSNH